MRYLRDGLSLHAHVVVEQVLSRESHTRAHLLLRCQQRSLRLRVEPLVSHAQLNIEAMPLCLYSTNYLAMYVSLENTPARANPDLACSFVLKV